LSGEQEEPWCSGSPRGFSIACFFCSSTCPFSLCACVVLHALVWRFARNLLWLSVTFPGFFLGSVFLLCVQLLLIMSSSGFSFEEFDSLLVAAAADVPSSSTPTARPPSLLASSSSLSSSSHGESSTVVMAGASFSGGVRSGGRGSTSRGESASPSKRVSVLLDPSHTALCLGLMASAKFCIRPLAEGSRSCGTAAHVKKFQPPPSSAFLKDTEVRAFCTPVLDLSVMSPAQRLRIQGVQLTLDEWIQLFQQVAQHKPPSGCLLKSHRQLQREIL
jgi:hypothetical protein